MPISAQNNEKNEKKKITTPAALDGVWWFYHGNFIVPNKISASLREQKRLLVL
jgi:hypothetical protein